MSILHLEHTPTFHRYANKIPGPTFTVAAAGWKTKTQSINTHLSDAGTDGPAELLRPILVPGLPLEFAAAAPVHQHLEYPMPPDVRLQRCRTDGGRVLHVRLAGTVDALDLYPAHVAGVAQLVVWGTGRNGRG